MKHYLDQIDFIVGQIHQSLITCMLISGKLFECHFSPMFWQYGKIKIESWEKEGKYSFKCPYKVDIVLNNKCWYHIMVVLSVGSNAIQK